MSTEQLFPYANPLINRFPVQTDATQLTGVSDKGRFRMAFASRIVGVYGNSDTDVDWTISIILPDLPGTTTPEADRTFILNEVKGSPYIANNDNWKVPAGSIILLTSSAGTNLRGVVTYMLQRETF